MPGARLEVRPGAGPLGEAQAVLTVLDARGVAVPEAIREQILACTDLTQLDTWLRCAVTAATAEDVIRP